MHKMADVSFNLYGNLLACLCGAVVACMTLNSVDRVSTPHMALTVS